VTSIRQLVASNPESEGETVSIRLRVAPGAYELSWPDDRLGEGGRRDVRAQLAT
jgi:hypothetical protein